MATKKPALSVEQPTRTAFPRTLKMHTHPNSASNVVDNRLVIEVDIPGAAASDLDVQVIVGHVKVVGKRVGVPFEYRVAFDDRTWDAKTCKAELVLGALCLVFEANVVTGPIKVNVVEQPA